MAEEERSPLDVKGWVSGLKITLAIVVALIGLAGLAGLVGELRQSGLTAVAVSNFVVASCLPLGVWWFFATLRNVRDEQRRIDEVHSVDKEDPRSSRSV